MTPYSEYFTMIRVSAEAPSLVRDCQASDFREGVWAWTLKVKPNRPGPPPRSKVPQHSVRRASILGIAILILGVDAFYLGTWTRRVLCRAEPGHMSNCELLWRAPRPWILQNSVNSAKKP